MDVVYVVRPGEANEELRYSLRALEAHVPHDQVWVAGFHPSWLTGVRHIPVRQAGTTWANATANIAAACEHPGVSDRFLWANDDMFAMAPVDGEVPAMHRGPVDDVIALYRQRIGASGYLDGMVRTRKLLDELGFEDPLCFDLHVPLVVDKAGMAEVFALGPGRVQRRTLYGNLVGLGGTRVDDVKVCSRRPGWSPSWPWISTDDASFAAHEVGVHIRGRFPTPSRYER